MEQEPLVYFRCVGEGSKLRVRITTPGYNHDANCQFPRAIRGPDKHFSAPVSAIKFARGPAGKFFYRVSPKQIEEVLDDERPNEARDLGANRRNAMREIIAASKVIKVKVNKVYEDDSSECIVCFDAEHEVVIVPCGHFCMCGGCAHQVKEISGKCPVCRGNMEQIVTRDQIQT